MGFTEKFNFQGGGSPKTNIEGGLLINGTLGQFADLGGKMECITASGNILDSGNIYH